MLDGLAASSQLSQSIPGAGGFTESDARRDLTPGAGACRPPVRSLAEATLAATLPLYLIGWFGDTGLAKGRCCGGWRVAYGVRFIIHPPVIVGLALALHQTAFQRN